MKKLNKIILILLLVCITIGLSTNFYIIYNTKDKIVNNYNELKDISAIVVLGSGVKNNEPSPILKDRLDEGIKLYNEGISSKIIMSGDGTHKEKDEVTVMKNYAIKQGIPEENIITDQYGLSTYDTIKNMKETYKLNKIILVTQKYHLYRALYISDKYKLDSYGSPSDLRKHSGVLYRESRELLARTKDFFKCLATLN